MDEKEIIKKFNAGYLPEHKTRKIILYDEIIYSRMKMVSNPSMSEKVYRYLMKSSLSLKFVILFFFALLIFNILSNNFKVSLGLSIILELISLYIYCISNRIKIHITNKKQKSLLKLADPRDDIKKILEPGYLEGLYCQLKLNLDKNKSYTQANEFYFGEKLWERKKLFHEKRGKPMWFFLWFYWALNGYGNRPVRTIINFILLLLLFSWGLLQLGLIDKTINDEKKSSNSLCYVMPLNRDSEININSMPEPLAYLKTCVLPIVFWKYSNFYKTVFSNFIKYQSLYIDRVSSFLIFNNLYMKERKSSKSKFTIEDIFDVSLWNLSVSPGNKAGDYNPTNSIASKISIFYIQWLFRPFMVAMVIISVRRKIQRH